MILIPFILFCIFCYFKVWPSLQSSFKKDIFLIRQNLDIARTREKMASQVVDNLKHDFEKIDQKIQDILQAAKEQIDILIKNVSLEIAEGIHLKQKECENLMLKMKNQTQREYEQAIIHLITHDVKTHILSNVSHEDYIDAQIKLADSLHTKI